MLHQASSCNCWREAEHVPKLYRCASLPDSVQYLWPSGWPFARSSSASTREQPSRNPSSCSCVSRSLTTTVACRAVLSSQIRQQGETRVALGSNRLTEPVAAVDRPYAVKLVRLAYFQHLYTVVGLQMSSKLLHLWVIFHATLRSKWVGLSKAFLSCVEHRLPDVPEHIQFSY